jgi:hypothetical protein
MSEQADYVLQDIAVMDDLRDQYVNGLMPDEEAYHLGFVDEMCTEQEGIQEAWDRSSIPTVENLNTELLSCTKDLLIAESQKHQPVQTTVALNKTAIKNLEKENPTCNQCHKEMHSRKGKYGKFYYCTSQCKGQSTVSDKYWQSIRKK